MRETKRNLTKKLTESAIMIAFATVLSVLKLFEMPYGGSVTVASMLPILIIAYRHGIGMGLGAGFVFAAVQQLLGLNNLSYVTGWQSVLAVMLLDYIIAFTVIGLGGIFKGKINKKTGSRDKIQSFELALGMLFVCILRYLCHTVAGATVWAGLSIPTEAALIYSLGYNATYMIPETVVNVMLAVFIGSAVDFLKDIPTRMKKNSNTDVKMNVYAGILSLASKIFIIITVIADTLLIFAHLQDPESGKFTFEYIKDVDWEAFIIVSAVGLCVSAVLYISAAVIEKKSLKR